MTKNSIPLIDGALYKDDKGMLYTVANYDKQGDIATFELIASDDPEDINADAFDLTSEEWGGVVSDLNLTLA